MVDLPTKRRGKKPAATLSTIPRDDNEDPGSESDRDIDVVSDRSSSHPSVSETDSALMRRILYDESSRSDGEDDKSQGDDENDGDEASEGSQSRSGSDSRSGSSGSESGSRSGSVSQSRSPSRTSRSGSMSQSPSRSRTSRSRTMSQSPSRSRTSRYRSQASDRSGSISGSRSPSQSSRPTSSDEGSQSRSRSSRSRSHSPSQAQSDPPESNTSPLQQSNPSISERESDPSSHAASSQQESSPSHQSGIGGSKTSSNTPSSRSGSDPPESPQRKPSVNSSSGSSSRSHPWDAQQLPKSPSKLDSSGKVSMRSSRSESSQAHANPHNDSKKSLNDSFNGGGKSVLQRMEEQRRTKATQDTSKETFSSPSSEERPPKQEEQKPSLEASDVSDDSFATDDNKSREQEKNEQSDSSSTEKVASPNLGDQVETDSKKEAAGPAESEYEAQGKDTPHRYVVHDKDDWKPPALTTYGEVTYIPSHGYHKSGRDPDALEPGTQKEISTPIEATRSSPKKKKKAPVPTTPPIPEITVSPPTDDESTLGAHGDYLDRFPKKNKKKATQTPDVVPLTATAAAHDVPSFEPQPTPAVAPVSASAPAPALKSALKSSPAAQVQSEYDQYKSWLQANIGRPKQQNDASDEYYKAWIQGESSGGKNLERADPPEEMNLFPYNPVDPLTLAMARAEEQPVSSYPNSVQHANAKREVLRNSTWVPEQKKDIDGGDSIPSVPKYYYKSERSMNSAWAAPGESGQRSEYDIEMESRRRYVESIISKKRPYNDSRDRKGASYSRSKYGGRAARIDFTGTVKNSSSSTPPSSSSYTRSSTSRSSSSSSASRSQETQSRSSSGPSSSSGSMLRSKQSDSSFYDHRGRLQPASLPGKSGDSETSHSIKVEDESETSHTIDVVDESRLRALNKLDDSSGPSHDIQVVDDSSRMQAHGTSSPLDAGNDEDSSSQIVWPNAKDQNVPSRRAPPYRTTTVVFVLVVLILFILAGVGVAVYFFVFREDESQPNPTPAPTPIASRPDTSPQGLQDLIISVSPATEEAFDDPASPQSLSLDWLAGNQLLSTYSSDQLLQRFTMATLYFSTDGESWFRDDLWLSNISECEWYTSETQVQVCRPNGEFNVLDLNSNSLGGTVPWDELAILKDQLRFLDLFSNQVSGSLASEVGDFTSLRALDLQNNLFSSTIPREIRQLTSMRHFVLADNSFTGTIPPGISRMTDLVTLNLRRNALEGTIPNSIRQLSNLRNLLLDGNNLVGSIPVELCLMELDRLVVDCDLVSCDCCSCGGEPGPPAVSPPPPSGQNPTASPPPAGTPTAGNDLQNLIITAFPEGEAALQDPDSPQSRAFTWLESSSNDSISSAERYLQRYALAVLYYSTNGSQWTDRTAWLSSTNECSWWSSENAVDVCDSLGRYLAIDLQENNLLGNIPPEVAMLADTLSTIHLSSNSLTGTLPPALFDATNLRQLSLFSNGFAGSLPSEVGQLTRLESLDVGSNQLEGELPTTLGLMSRLAGLSVYGNLFTGPLPDEIGNLSSLQLLYADSNDLRGPFPTDLCLLNLQEFWSDCEEIQCVCCTTCCSDNFGCTEA